VPVGPRRKGVAAPYVWTENNFITYPADRDVIGIIRWQSGPAYPGLQHAGAGRS
jgi:hypothetical protein